MEKSLTQLSLSNGIGRLYRAGYVISMYSGFRAVFNRLRSRWLPPLRAAAMSRRTLVLDDGTEVTTQVHSRHASGAFPNGQRAGMISVRLVAPKIARPIYAWLCMTSHFGCGHIEIAFYEERERLVVFGVRNMLKANAWRIGLKARASKLQLCEDSDEVRVLTTVCRFLTENEFHVAFAEPSVCVQLAVDPSLLKPNKRDCTMDVIRKKYVRIWKQVRLESLV